MPADPSDEVETPSPAAARRLFVTAGAYNGNLLAARSAPNGLLGADQICTDAARSAGLEGDFIAWISDSTTDAMDRVGGDGPWALLDGTVAFPDHAALAEQPATAINVTQFGDAVGIGLVWTGTFADGTRTNRHCVSWTDDTTDAPSFHPVTGYAGSTDGMATWSFLNEVSCFNELHLYCFEQ